MFSEHQPVIAAYARSNPDACISLIDVVLQTVRTPFYLVGPRIKDVRQNELNSVYLKNATKRKAFKRLRVIKTQLHEDIFSDDKSIEEKLLILSGIPGLGIAKSGFVLQLCIGKSGCLDVHNLRRFNIDEKTFKLRDNTKHDTALNKARLYTDTIKKLGGTEKLWNDWCKLIAHLYPKHYNNALHVSRLHVDFILKV